ncbi:MAG: AMP-binding protein [Crocinitomix sp.]|nr:AMP-binding protein [Crocinitomix sp.]
MNPKQKQLCDILSVAWHRSFYRNHWKIESINEAYELVNSGNFHALPITRKSNIREAMEDIIDYSGAVDIVSSSGTTGRPVDIPVLEKQEKERILRVRRLLRELGIKHGSKVLQLLSLNDMFTLGVLVWQGIKAEGGTAFRCSPARIDRILDVIKYSKPEFVIGNPYVMVRIAEEAGDKWPKPEDLPKGAFFAVAATFCTDLKRNVVAEKAMKLWGLTEALNQYGTSEIGPVAYETKQHEGLLVHSDFLYVELIDPTTGKPAIEGESGEVVVTALTHPRGFLPVRYATGDICAWLKHKEIDGETKQFMGPIIGRVDHQLKIMGQTIFPNHLLKIADDLEQIKKSVVTVKQDVLKGDVVTVLCEAQNVALEEEVKKILIGQYNRNLAVSPNVSMVKSAVIETLVQNKMSATNGSKVPRFFRL